MQVQPAKRLGRKHFSDSDFERDLKQELLGYTSKNKRPLKPDAVPTLNLPVTAKRSNAEKSTSQLSRQHRMERKKNSEFVDSIIQQYDALHNDTRTNGTAGDDGVVAKELLKESTKDVTNITKHINSNTFNAVDMRRCDCYKTIAALEEEIRKLKQENSELREKHESAFGRLLISNKSQPDTKMEIVIYAVDP
ncbi:hypothetical protein CHUAL_005746 [Chamberlinius hualienensis]